MVPVSTNTDVAGAAHFLDIMAIITWGSNNLLCLLRLWSASHAISLVRVNARALETAESVLADSMLWIAVIAAPNAALVPVKTFKRAVFVAPLASLKVLSTSACIFRNSFVVCVSILAISAALFRSTRIGMFTFIVVKTSKEAVSSYTIRLFTEAGVAPACCCVQNAASLGLTSVWKAIGTVEERAIIYNQELPVVVDTLLVE
jgi:hypothetical protein